MSSGTPPQKPLLVKQTRTQMMMAVGYTRNPAAELPQANPRSSKATTTKTEAREDTTPLQFVTTTSTVAIDESSKRAIRKHASRYVYRARPQQFQGDNTPATRNAPKGAAGGQIHRFRLGPQGLKHTPNQPPQVSQNFEIMSVKTEDERESRSLVKDPTSINTVHIFRQENENIFKDDDEDKKGKGSSSFEPLRYRRQQETGLESLLSSRGGSLFGPSSGTMDPFNAMALPITPREQILLRYYFMDHRQVDAPLIPYCQAWFGLAVQDKAYLHAVLSHYSAIHRMRFQEESPTEAISHLTTAIQLITERLQDPTQCCSNGTIGAVASLLIYESANGALPNVAYHMSGLKEMVMRRGGLERADFSLDLKRLIGWTDLNTANDLWQKPRFPALELPMSVGFAQTGTGRQDDFALASSSRFDLTPASYQFSFSSQSQSIAYRSSSFTHTTQATIDTILLELRSFAKELDRIKKLLNPLNRPQISTSDKIHVLERKIFDLIHTPFSSSTALDHACAVATLIYMRSNLRDSICNFRIIETGKLQTALMELGDLWQWGNDLRDREKLVWTVGLGAVSSAGRPERPWFVSMFRHVCESLGLRRWQYVKAVFETVLWKSELDIEGMRVWEDMKMDEMV